MAGAKVLREKFVQIRKRILCRKRDHNDLQKEVRGMREKMWAELRLANKGDFNLKKSPGGITDIEFMVQYLVLAYATKHPVLCEWTDNVRILEGLAQAVVGDAKIMRRLAVIYQQMRDEIHRRLLKDEPVVIEGCAFAKESEFVQQCWQNFLIND